METKEIVVITERPIPENIYHEIRAVSSIDFLPNQGCYAVVIDIQHPTWFDELVKLRQRPCYQLIPLFYWGNSMNHFEQLFDGIFDQNSLVKASEIQNRISLIPNKEFTNEMELLLLSYLFCRESFILKGHFNYHDPSGFDYPLLKVLFQKNSIEESWAFLQSMVTRNLLKHEQMVDEIQICPHCKSGLLNFKNCCPNCQSVDVTPQQFVHCFTCGNIGPISTFLKHEQLSCDRCNSQLRHIGIDYDKPLEDKLCNQCGFYFFESEVMAICMVCLKLMKPDDLEARKLYEYSIAKRGEQLAKGTEQTVFQNIQHFFKMIDFHSFMILLNWQIKLSKRYEQHIFMLLILKVSNIEQLIEKKGILNTEKILEQFFERLCSVFRDSDLVTREDTSLLFFLPMTSGEDKHFIFEKVKEFTSKQFPNTDEITLKIELGDITSSEIIAGGFNNELLIAELHNRAHAHE
ncbi:TPA: zinc ribbon domain-containing protein [Legionella pneumophila]|uniref:TackOD1 domain-containing metal-binding protein n=1 Tax=Legionella pneumophila TaxID=446 RepID=UPI0007884206|nr:zinc ribbon domain-containing protein [Legionella pneumophila]HAU1193240.1 zinc ribbon domain-containing protein [Legionella pneumophila]HAU3942046.1 zinc ribbon domain-containing protein [Legionella pneumophila]HBD7103504.1 zinc ribbon domain-containing protein [Legionella pneumophila]HCO4740103.1 zinc ribbon domain-containing protein [Legionella pneumophila]HDU7930949.1 zinc ribbon domain-containing protein [Legionella pneumophila]